VFFIIQDMVSKKIFYFIWNHIQALTYIVKLGCLSEEQKTNLMSLAILFYSLCILYIYNT